MALKNDDTAGALNVPRYFEAEKVNNFTISYNFNNSKKMYRDQQNKRNVQLFSEKYCQSS